MTTDLVQNLLNSPAGQSLTLACRQGEIDARSLFQSIKHAFQEDSHIKTLSQNEQNALFGQLSAKLRSLCVKNGKPKKKEKPQQIKEKDLPGPLHQLLTFYKAETNAFRQVHRLIDLFEWTMKWHTVLVMSDLLREAQLTDEVKVLFASGLRVPSLGIWNLFFRESLSSIEKPSMPWQQWQKLINLEKKHNIVSFRNGYAHGATPSEEKCAKDCQQYFPIWKKLIASPIFAQLQMVLSTEEGGFRWVGTQQHPSSLDLKLGQVGVVHRDTPDKLLFNLWPLGTASIDPQHSDKGRQFFFFNALKNKKIEQLNYEWSLHYRDKQLWNPFHAALPLDEWKKVNTTPALELFRERIEALTEIFKGRQLEKSRLRAFCLTGEGNQMVWGPPGIGKSALLAQVFKEIRGGVDADGLPLDDTYPPILPYFIRRGTDSSTPERFLRHLCQQLDQLYGLKGMGMGNASAELYESLQKRLQAISEQPNPQKMVLFVDGLDEALRFGSTILSYIPTARSWLSVLSASRQVPQVEEWYHRREKRSEFQVTPLSQNDIRALLYEVVSKYDQGLTPAYIEAIAQRSQGNPLYLKLLCDQLSAGAQTVGDIDQLPKEMADLYKEVIKRVTNGGRNEAVTCLLWLLTETKASLSVQAVSDFLDISGIAAQTALDDCMELLYEDPLTPDILDYQLFHESLREYLRATDGKACRKIAKQVTDLCADWQSREEQSLDYALQFASTHLHEQNDGARLWTLLQDEIYRQTQIRRSMQFDHSYLALKEGLGWYIDQQGATPEMDARLAWLALRAGDLAHEAVSGVGVAFDWFRQDVGRLDDALKRIECLDEVGYFKATLLLMWIEADRQREMDEDKRDVEVPRTILKAMEERIPEGTGTIDWGKFLSIGFLASWVGWVVTVWKGIDFESFEIQLSGLLFWRKGIALKPNTCRQTFVITKALIMEDRHFCCLKMAST